MTRLLGIIILVSLVCLMPAYILWNAVQGLRGAL